MAAKKSMTNKEEIEFLESDQFSYFEPNESFSSDQAYFDDVPERDWPDHISNPEGWDKAWPFAAEVALWLIPGADRKRALYHEEERERIRLTNVSHAGDDAPILKPWLALTDEGQKWVSDHYYKSFDYPTAQQGKAVFFLTLSEFKVMIKRLPSAVHRSIARWFSNWSQTGELPADTLDRLTDSKVICAVEKASSLEVRDIRNLSIGIARWATRKEAEDGFSALLDELEAKNMIKFEKPKKGKRDSDSIPQLAALALSRLHANDPISLFWEALIGTQLKTWSERDDKQKIRKKCQRKISENSARLLQQ